MKTTTTLLKFAVLFVIVFSSCRKRDPEIFKMTDAVITGYDLRKCMCCGGLLINFENNPEQYSGTYYLIDEMPSNSGINESTKFPLYVKVQYSIDKEKCGGNMNFVDIQKIRIK
ncbi:MAG: hypothetical protein Q8M15_08770 [Bacteroidota bacterium]|nr:hypothetical protein [Bacteroidota bacterium]